MFSPGRGVLAMALSCALLLAPVSAVSAEPSGGVAGSDREASLEARSAGGSPGVGVNLSVTDDTGTTTLLAEGSTVAVGSSVTVGSAGLLSPGVGDREIRTTLDPLTAYTAGSAVAPEGWTINYSADSGTSWSSSQPNPASSVTDIRATASNVAAGLIEGTSQIYSSETTSAIPSSTFLANAGGDGYDAFFYEDYVFNIFHHENDTRIMCHLKATAQRCPGFATPFVVSGYMSSMRSTGWVDAVTGRLYAIGTRNNEAWAVCVDVSTSTPSFCGATQLSTGGGIGYWTHIAEGVPAGRRLFGVETAGANSLLCFDAVTGDKCAGTPIALEGASTTGGGQMSLSRPAYFDGKLFVITSSKLYCFVPETLATCAGSWPATVTQWNSSGKAMGIAPHVNASDQLDGVCYYKGNSGSNVYSCLELDGTPNATWKSPFILGVPVHPHITMGVETLGRFYYGSGQYVVGCWDYDTQAACVGFGTNGYKTFPNAVKIIYGVTLDPQNPACLWVNTDAGYIYNFDAYSGEYGCEANPVITLQPSQFAPRYACSTAAGITEWTALRLVSLAGGGSASSVALTVRTAEGATVSGWTNVPVTVGGELNMSGLDPGVSGSRPTFSFAFSGITGTVSTADIALDYKGKGPELCVGTVATSASPPESASVSGTLTETLSVVESFTQSRSFQIGNASSIVEQTVPSAPQALSGSGLNTSASLTFQAPANDGGLPITSYVVSYDGGSTWSAASEVDNGDGTYTVSVSGLTPGSTYDMRLAAVNDMGRGASASVSVTAQLLTVDSLLDTPVNLGPLTLSSTTGDGLPLTYSSPSSSVCTVSGTTVSLVAQGTCVIVAFQAGDANADPIILPAESEGSFTVLPAYFEPTVPGVPTGVTVTPGDRQVAVSWTAPLADGYSDLTDYVIQYRSAGTWIPYPDGISTGTSAIVAGLSNGTAYDIRVAAVNSVGTGSYATGATATPATVPGAPTSLTGTVSGTNGTLTWTAPASTGGSVITDYIVEYKLSTEGTWTAFTDGVSASTGATVTGLSADSDYDFQVTTVNAVGSGGQTSTVNLSVTAGNGQATLDWAVPDSPGGTITGYEMQYRTAAGSWTTFADAYPQTDGTITGLSNGTIYYLRVATIIDSSTVSSYTSVVAVTPRTTPAAPAITLVPGNRQVVIQWSAPDSGGSPITDYTIQYKATSSPSWSTLVDGISTTTSATVTGLTNGTPFDFQVLSTNAAGVGPYSVPASATPRTTPQAPTGLAVASVGDGQLDLAWTAPADNGGTALTDYLVQYRPEGGFTWATVARAASTATSQSITGLTNGTSYSVRVASVNAAGTGTSATPVVGIPFGNPTSPRNVAVTMSVGSATVTWDLPANNGGSTITDYHMDYKPSAESTWTPWTHTPSSARTATITGLIVDTGYDLRIRTVTARGTSAYTTINFSTSTSSPTPTPAPVVLAGPPVGVGAVAGDGRVSVSWKPPVSSGSFPVSDYVMRAAPGGASCVVAVPVTSCVIEGLTNGVAYTVTGRALTGAGWGAASAPSAPVVPSSSAQPVPQPDPVPGPVPAGSVQVTIDGRLDPQATATPDANSAVVVVSGDYTVDAAALDAAGRALPLGEGNQVQPMAGQRLEVSGARFHPSTYAAVYVHDTDGDVSPVLGEPVIIGAVLVDELGMFTGAWVLPDAVVAGEYVLQVVGTTMRLEALSANLSMSVMAGEVRSITISARRDVTRSGAQRVGVFGRTDGLDGEIVQARVRYPGERRYFSGSTRRVEAGEFAWQRLTSRRIYVYFQSVGADGQKTRSNRIVIPRVSR